MIRGNITSFLNRARHTARLLAAAIVVLMLGGTPLPVRAHPADMYAQNLSLVLHTYGILLDWQILPGPFLADAVWAAADLDQSGSISISEANSWIGPFVSSLSAELDSLPLNHDGAQAVHWPASVELMRTGEDRIRFSLEFALPPDRSGQHLLQIHAAHLEANSLNWFAVAAEEGLAFEQPSQDNGRLDVRAHFDGSSPSGVMTSWNSGTPNLGGFSAVLSQLASGSTDPSQNGVPAASQGGGVTATLTNLVKTQEFSPIFLGSAFLLSLLLGSLHALTPGHGKALVGAYLVGSQGRTRDAVFLGGIVTLTHTGSVVLLGLVTLLASHYILPALIAPWLEIISGLLVIGFGLNLFLRRGGDLAKSLRGRTSDAHDHEHEHVHSHSHGHEHGHAHPHTHQGEPVAEAHPGGQLLPQITFRSLLTLGVSGGLVPCPDAIAILLVAVAVNRIPFGMLLILSFSIGLALVLIGIGIAMVNGVRLIARSELVSRFAVYAPVISAIVVTGLGAGLTLSAVKSLRFGTQVVESAAETRGAPVFDVDRARLLYVAADATGWDQLFMKPLSGGEARQLTFEEAGVTGYSVSPDGRTILYTLFKLDGGTAIQAVNSDGTDRRIVLDCPASECNSPRWYPDGTRLAYERLDDATEAVVPRFSIWWLDTDSGETRPLFQDSTFASSSPQFSPDGAWLSYISSADSTLILFNLEDSRTISLPLGLQSFLPVTWSPDSQRVLFGGQVDAGASPRTQAYALVSGAITDLGGPEGATDYSAAWSPDGGWIAIDRNVPLAPGQFGNQVWLVRPDGAEAHVLLQEPGASYSSLAWSPEGRHLLYARYVLDLSSAAPGRFDIYMTDVESGESELLVEGGDMPALLP